MMYMIPAKVNRNYRGKYPSRIYSVGSGIADADGNKCLHVETNCGERFTISYDRIKPEVMQGSLGFLEKSLSDIVISGTVVETLSQERYDTWLAEIRAQREKKGSK